MTLKKKSPPEDTAMHGEVNHIDAEIGFPNWAKVAMTLIAFMATGAMALSGWTLKEVVNNGKSIERMEGVMPSLMEHVTDPQRHPPVWVADRLKNLEEKIDLLNDRVLQLSVALSTHDDNKKNGG